ncbi:type VII secretion-associated serine protease mycosin [Amycolatopsis palatopharyngis]|uniref:type VII secretion-associated serine protease mycosin n=1 Tax=Amycolatopsis palatopharyngis TaxID=187982 RepID=UPI000E26C901
MGARRTHVRATSPARRLTALLLAAGIGALTPGVTAPVALAQPSVSADDGGHYAEPPAVDGGMFPAPSNQPDKNYVQEIGCVRRAELDDNVVLPNKPWGQQYLRIEDAQKLARSATGGYAGKYSNGKPVKVAVIDTGVTPHPFFQGRVEPGADYVKNVPPGPGLEDCDGHGTEVAGIIAANPTNPEIGFTGVAPDASIVSIRQSSQNYKPAKETAAPPSTAEEPASGEGDKPEDGGGGQPGGGSDQLIAPGTGPAQDSPGRQQGEADAAGTVDTLAQAVAFAAKVPGVKVINISINNCRTANGMITDPERRLQAAVADAYLRDIVVVAAAGNTGDTCKQNDQLDPDVPRSIVTPPWFSEHVLSVAAIDQTGGVADFSVHGPWVSVAAPGTDIISLDPAKDSDKLANRTVEGNGEPTPIQGTSFAAPYVSGVVALVRAKFPDLKAEAVINRIKSTAQHPAAPGGRDNFVGHGVINPVAALTATVPEEEGMAAAQPVQLPSDLPPSHEGDQTPMIVAFAGAGGGLVALFITLFVVHTARRNRPKST